MSRFFRYVACAVLLALAATSCRATPEFTATEVPAVPDRSHGRAAAPTPPPNPFADTVDGGGVDFRLQRTDLDCRSSNLNTYPDTPFLVAHMVVQGNLGAPCFGDTDERLLRAWHVLATITPPGQLHDLGIFGGFVSLEPDQTTLAFVNTLPENPALYQMSINLEQAELDPDELAMTMAHEFAHVLTSNLSPIDRTIYPKDCRTWHNYRGCYTEDSLMWAWVQEFWGDGIIGGVNAKIEPSRATGRRAANVALATSGPMQQVTQKRTLRSRSRRSCSDSRSTHPSYKRRWSGSPVGQSWQSFATARFEAGLPPLPNRFERCGR